MTSSPDGLSFVDSLILGSALASYMKYLEGQGKKRDHLYNTGATLWKTRYFSSFKTQLEEFIGKPFVEEGRAPQLKTPYRYLMRTRQVKRITDTLPAFMTKFALWLSANKDAFASVVGMRARRAILELSHVDFSEDPRGQLYALSLIRFTEPSAKRQEKWVDKAAKAAGVVVTQAEEAVRDLQVARTLGQTIEEISARISVQDSGSLESVDLKEQRSVAYQELEDLAQSMEEPQAAYSAAVSAMQGDAADEVVKKYGLTSQQEAVIRQEGPMVVAAGAGSGKTGTVVAKVDYMINKQGLNPEKVAVVSFTRAASAEVSHRIETKVGQTGTFLGRTTHALARHILSTFGGSDPVLRRKFGRNLSQAIRSTDNADKLWKVALKQVEMSVGEHEEEQEQIQTLLGYMSRLPSNRFFDSLRNWLQYRGMLTTGQLKALRKALDARGKAFVDQLLRSRTAARKPKLYSEYERTPAMQRFNIGAKDLIDPVSEVKHTPKRLKLAVDNLRTDRVSVDDAWKLVKEDEIDTIVAAAYDAYEWLKEHDQIIGPAMDYTDQIIMALEVLERSDRAKQRAQSLFDAMIVDEAQDLNQVQFDFFSILAEKAKVFALVGDDKQCLAKGSLVNTPFGYTKIEELKVGDEVLSWRNGEVAFQRVGHVQPTHWTHGFQVTTTSGRSLTMSPNHKLWATPPCVDGEEVAVYLMYRKDKGYRIGITNKGGGPEYLNTYGGRAFLEKAERMWIVDICPNREEALYREQELSLQYGIPTSVFEGEHRKLNQERLNQERLNRIFDQFGDRGQKLLEDQHLSFDLPHWMSHGYTKHDRGRHIIHLKAHGKKGSLVSLEWPLDTELFSAGSRFASAVTSGKNHRIRKMFSNYREASNYAELLRQETDAAIMQRLSTPFKYLSKVTASGLFPGMKIMACDQGHVFMDEIESVESVAGEFYGLDVEDASNFFAEDILTSNSIYAFRGAKPSNFIGMTSREGVATLTMDLNWRSGSQIVEAANRLIAHNTDQIPMVCTAHPSKGTGQIRIQDISTHEDAAALAAEQIAASIRQGDSPSDFGILVRNNAEMDAFCLQLITRGVPYRLLRGNISVFDKFSIRAMLAWIRLSVGGTREQVNEAVLHAHRTPGFGLNQAFGANLEDAVSGTQSYLDYLLSGKPVYTGRQSYRNNKFVKPYVDAIKYARAFDSLPTSELMQQLLKLPGLQKTFEAALMEKVDPSDINEEGGEDDITEDQIRAEALAPLRPFLELASHLTNPSNFMDMAQKMKDANIRAQKNSPTTGDDFKEPAVLIGTTHSWKGLQAKHVFVEMAGAVFPYQKKTKLGFEEPDPVALREERRLAYVAITRGEQSVTVLNPAVNYRGQEDSPPSPFLSEMCVPVEDQAEEAAEAEAEAIVEDRDLSEMARVASQPRYEGMFASNIIETFLGFSPRTAVDFLDFEDDDQ